jgi:diacylglycerol kinase (ATP)
VKTIVIVNPTSGIGRGARVLAALKPLLARRGVTDVRLTARAGDTERLTRAAVEEGANAIIALGGDGTWSQAAATIARLRAPTRLALLAAGTGNDFVRTLELPARDATATLDLIDAGRTRAIDVGVAGETYFLNSVGFGFDAHVLRHMSRPPFIPAKALYTWVAARELFRYHGVHAAVDGGARERLLALVVANGRRFGSLFWIAPTASLEDGALDLVRVADAGAARRIGVFASVMRGTHARSPLTRTARAPSFRLVFDEPPVFQADGEVVHAASREIVVAAVPRAVNLVAA